MVPSGILDIITEGVRSITVQAAVTATGTGLSGEKAL